jgi:hypothetical protein
VRGRVPGHVCGEGCDRPAAQPRMIAGRSDWPCCPVAVTADPSWRAVCDLYLASQVSPLSPWPDGYPAWVVAAMVALRAAVETERARKIEQARHAPGVPALPRA